MMMHANDLQGMFSCFPVFPIYPVFHFISEYFCTAVLMDGGVGLTRQVSIEETTKDERDHCSEEF